MKKIKTIMTLLLLSSVLSINACTDNENADKDNSGDDLFVTLALMSLLSENPKIRMANSSGATETYTFHSSSACGASTLVYSLSANPVANGTTTAYETLPGDGGYYISYNGGVNCNPAPLVFADNITYTITATASVYSISSP